MRSKTALVNTLAAGIAAAGAGEQLENVFLYGTARGSVNVEGFSKVMRVDMKDATLIRTNEETRREQAVQFEIQCFVLPSEQTLEAEDTAVENSFDLAEAVFDLLHANPTLDGGVTDLDIPEDEINIRFGMANLGAKRYGATYLRGYLNPY